MSSQAKRGSFFYTLLGYLLILIFLLATALLIGAILYRFVIVPERFPPIDAFAKWSGLAIFTIITLWWVIKKSKVRWRSRVFWIVLVPALVVHIASFLVFFHYAEHWSDWYFPAIFMVEAPIFLSAVNRTCERFERKHQSKDRAAHM